MKLHIVYFAYPYTSDPHKRTDEIKMLVRDLIASRAAVLGHHDIVPIVPHVTFDGLYDYPTGYDHTFMLGWEYEIIERVDAICFAPTDIESSGVEWEKHFAVRVDTPRADYDMLVKGVKFEACLVVS